VARDRDEQREVRLDEHEHAALRKLNRKCANLCRDMHMRVGLFQGTLNWALESPWEIPEVSQRTAGNT
jgi:hypothetical protein